MPARLGDATPTRFRLGDSAPSRVYSGDSLVWAAFTNMGMDKSGDFAIPQSANNVLVTGWGVRSGFPGSTIINNGELRADGAQAVTVNCRISISGFGNSQWYPTFQIRRNGTQVLATQPATNSPQVINFPATPVTLAANDRIGVYVSVGQLYSYTVTAGAANTYLYFQ